jgi:quercetin dioxygenase-like cupin family protein
MADQNSDRLRPHPKERFAAPQHQFNLDETIATLRQELQSGQAGHRQQALYKHGPTSISLFLFGHFTRLPPHRVDGVVSIHVLKGHLRVMAQGESHDLRSGHLLVLAPGIEHDVVAHEESEVLLTVNLESTDSRD